MSRGRQRLRSVPTTPGDASTHFHQYSLQVHQALHEWTAKVDTKASVVLSLETAAFGAVLAFSSASKPLGHLHGSEVWFYRFGISLLIGGILFAGAAVFPQLNRRDARRNWRSNYVYFGHLRWWAPDDLITVVQANGLVRDPLVMSTQIVALSKIVWRKHVFLQWSMSLAILGAAGIGLAALLR
ncbi:hypothetical protein GCM10010151_31690 [Actinoallomurus spadix]|uniref:Pycsar effector protein domain-containing protein n=1 Tax=Actinoallomurus spadix TaxID=79912 RepID=A0ABP3G9A0_9ACTN